MKKQLLSFLMIIVASAFLSAEIDVILQSKISQIFSAIELGRDDDFFRLLPDLGPSCRSNSGRTLLCFAIEHGRNVFVIRLLQNKASLIDKDKDGASPLERAVRDKNYLALIFILQAGFVQGADFALQELFIEALKAGDGDAVHILLLYGADCLQNTFNTAKDLSWWGSPGSLKLRLIKILLQLSQGIVSSSDLERCIVECSAISQKNMGDELLPCFEEDEVLRFRLLGGRFHKQSEELTNLLEAYGSLYRGLFEIVKHYEPTTFALYREYIDSTLSSSRRSSQSKDNGGLCLLL